MTREEQKFERAIRMIKETYEKALKDPHVHKPLSYTLYQVWRYYDTREKER